MDSISDIARRLAREAEAVCRHYLSSGNRQGRYWLVGDVDNNPGRSLFVRLTGPDSGKGAAGKWTDAAAGTHGDLLDLIRENQRLANLQAAADEARRFLLLPRPESAINPATSRSTGAPRPEAARRLWAMAGSLAGTPAAIYLDRRGIKNLSGAYASLRYHPACYHRTEHSGTLMLPALIAAVTDDSFALTGLQRTYLDRMGEKTDLADPRRAMGSLLGNGVRFGFDRRASVIAAGEGIETMLSLRQVLPLMPMVAALSSAHLAALVIGPAVKRLYIAEDADGAGRRGVEKLAFRARSKGLEVLPLKPAMGDFNDDLRHAGLADLTLRICAQLTAADTARFIRR